MKFKSIDEIAQFLRHKGERLKALSSSQLLAVREKAGAHLPKTYIRFLELMGRGAGSFMEGSSAFIDELFYLREGVDELILQHELKPLPDDAFVFWMHQGYQAAFFRTKDGDDPPVYFYAEGHKMTEFILLDKTLTDFFARQLLFSYPELIDNTSK